METLLYSMILVPLALYLIAFGYETLMSISRLVSGAYQHGSAFVHATWEVTHTLLVYSFVIFMTTHSTMMPALAPIMFVPVSIIAIALMLRAALYLYLFYGNESPKAPKLVHFLFALMHIVPLVALAWGGVVVAQKINQLHMTPNTDHLWIVCTGLLITLAFCVIPLSRLYSTFKEKPQQPTPSSDTEKTLSP